MLRTILLISGLSFLLAEQYWMQTSSHTQLIIFVIGILVLGIPHGAADVLVAAKTAAATHKSFSTRHFLFIYLGRLVVFGTILYFFPLSGLVLFIALASYHFGETDLHQFKTHTISGKIFVLSYGLLILSVILLPHLEAVRSVFQSYDKESNNQVLLEWAIQNWQLLLTASGIFFFTSTFLYFYSHHSSHNPDKGQFLIRLAFLLIILFNLPLLLSFTFYFVIWHSLLSLKNIFRYLLQKSTVSLKTITQQMLFYSTLAIAGIGVLTITGNIFMGEVSVAGYIFFGLAILTAPHMEIMYKMYETLRQK